MTRVFPHLFYIVIQKLGFGLTQAISDEFYHKVTGISTWVGNWQLPQLNIEDTDGGNPAKTHLRCIIYPVNNGIFTISTGERRIFSISSTLFTCNSGLAIRTIIQLQTVGSCIFYFNSKGMSNQYPHSPKHPKGIRRCFIGMF